MNVLSGYVFLTQDILQQINSSGGDKVTTQPNRTTANIAELFGLIVLLLIILVAAYFTTRLLGNVKKNQLSNSNFTFIEAYPIGQGKTLQIIKIGTRYMVVSVTKEQISCLAELSEDEISLPTDRDNNHNISFHDIMNKVIKKQSARDQKIEKHIEK